MFSANSVTKKLSLKAFKPAVSSVRDQDATIVPHIDTGGRQDL